VLPSQKQIDCLAERIERAFNLRHPEWYQGCSTARVWSSAALVLWQVHCEDPGIPLDPELFVASQPHGVDIDDPWRILAGTEAGRRYRRRVRKIVRLLRTELKREIRIVEREVRDGSSLSDVLLAHNPRLSPLGLYITAVRFGCPDLAGQFQSRAAQQHSRCPLYRWASLSLLAAEHYPSESAQLHPQSQEDPTIPRKVASLN